MPSYRSPRPRRLVVLACAVLLGWAALLVGPPSGAGANPHLDPEPPELTLPGEVEFVVGRAGDSYVIESDGDPVPAIGVDGLPEGLQLVAHGDGTATISGTPTGPAGTSRVEVRAQSRSGSMIRSLTITVEQSPAFVATAPPDFRVGELGSVDVRTAGFPAPSIGLDGDLPTGLRFVDNGDGTGTISGTPVDAGESAPVTLTAVNVVADVSQTITIRVRAGVGEASSAASSIPYAEPRWDI